MSRDFYAPENKGWIDLIHTKKNKWSWEQVKLLGQDSWEKCEDKLSMWTAMDEDIYPEIDIEDWKKLVDTIKHQDEDGYPVVIGKQTDEAQLRYPIMFGTRSAWQCYKTKLIEEGKLPGSAIDDIERSSCKIMQYLDDGRREEKKTIHGLVVGNVQSGKTANMEGLMSMAADAGWNLFIILSGTIENLRNQTRSRMADDLKCTSLSWTFFNNPSTRAPETKPSNLRFGDTCIECYVVVCLKNSTRLKRLLQWLNYDKNKKKQMRVLLIDDESDQASINTKKMEEGTAAEDIERTRINDLIMRIVNGNVSESDDKIAPYMAMNYIAYTATPYGNFLNESGEKSLYPSDFITMLPISDTYFGPKQIFGDLLDGTMDGLPIINRISMPDRFKNDENDNSDYSIIELINEEWKTNKYKGIYPELPSSLKEAVAWFCVCIAIQRYRKSKNPVSMLIHHSMKVEYHTSIAYVIRKWFDGLNIESFLNICQRAYNDQTKKMSRDDFWNIWPIYGYSCGLEYQDIRDYPLFKELVPYLEKLKANKVRHIKIEDDDTMSYFDGIHLCIDNSRNEAVAGDDESSQVRLIYPDKNTDDICDAPAFLIVGGNTLSRGLTLEGLVCTYFSRDVRQADTLMQMGRWFGYRRGYELLPRIWITKDGQERFEQLAVVDISLRNDIMRRYGSEEFSPRDYGPVISRFPEFVRMQLTAKNKMQAAEAAEMNYAGIHTQTARFYSDESILQQNLVVSDEFLTSLGDSVPGLTSEYHRVWENVPFKQIKEKLFDKTKWILGNMTTPDEFCQWFSQVAGEFDDWTIVLSGKKSANSTWHGIGKITRSRLKPTISNGNEPIFTIGVLSDPNVWQADIPVEYRQGKDDSEKSILKQGSQTGATNKEKEASRLLKQIIRERAGKKNTPRLVFYCIDHTCDTVDKNSKTRMPISTACDVVGIEMMIPGNQMNRDCVAAVTIKIKKDEETL